MMFTLFVSALVSPRLVRVGYQSAVAVQERHGKHSAFQSENRTYIRNKRTNNKVLIRLRIIHDNECKGWFE